MDSLHASLPVGNQHKSKGVKTMGQLPLETETTPSSLLSSSSSASSLASPPARHILELPVEVLSGVLTCIDHEADRMINVDRRGYLSQESFSAPARPSEQQRQDLGNFRLVCRRFSDIGAKHQFLRVTIRFNRQDFERLLGIASSSHLARIVRKFSYMVPCGFYHQRGQQRLKSPPRIPGENLQPYIDRQREHCQIIENGLDIRAVTRALESFTNLQHVQLIKLQDVVDTDLEMLRDRYEDLENWIRLDWEAACIHGTRTICEALLRSRSPCTRFSSPHLNSGSAMRLATEPPAQDLGLDSQRWYRLADQLTCLELHFDRDHQWFQSDEFNMLPFEPILGSATNLEALHVGFPFPIAARLEDVFHGIKWEKLVAFGIQGWELEAAEIIAMAQRHKARLRGLRLRSVFIKAGSRWVDVLHYLRTEMPQLEWVSLRHIGYQAELDARSASIEVPEDFELQSDSDESDAGTSSSSLSSLAEAISDAGTHSAQYEPSDAADTNGDDIGSVSSQNGVSEDYADLGLAFPQRLEAVGSSGTSAAARSGSEARKQLLSLARAEMELNEDFQRIKPDKRRYWENWVVRGRTEYDAS